MTAWRPGNELREWPPRRFQWLFCLLVERESVRRASQSLFSLGRGRQHRTVAVLGLHASGPKLPLKTSFQRRFYILQAREGPSCSTLVFSIIVISH